MSATKSFRTSTRVAALLLSTSLVLNVYLWGRADRQRPAVFAAPATSAKMPDAKPASAGLTLMALVNEDLPTLRDALLAAGATETRARQIVYGVLRRRYREALTQKRLASIERGWWKDEQRTLGITRVSPWLGDDPVLLKELIDDPIEALFGLDPTQAEVVNARYSYMPEEMRMKLARLERETQVQSQMMPTGDPEVDGKAEIERAALLKENQAQKEKLLASLTPEQLREHEMRYGRIGMRLANQFQTVPGGTEEEFRKMYRLAEESASNAPAPSASGVAGIVGMTPAEQATAAATQRTFDRVISELGYDRALDYLWSGAAEYRGVATVAQQANLPLATAARFTQLAAETGAKAAAIHRDAALTSDQRRAALLAPADHPHAGRCPCASGSTAKATSRRHGVAHANVRRPVQDDCAGRSLARLVCHQR